MILSKQLGTMPVQSHVAAAVQREGWYTFLARVRDCTKPYPRVPDVLEVGGTLEWTTVALMKLLAPRHRFGIC